ncbi:MAG TPA: hypothetical protein VLC09_14815 [Polyangiaceae bacterium]|nr:hypothetical protein [Polyangiaceae bacterium]
MIQLDPKQSPRSNVNVVWLGDDLYWGGGAEGESLFNDLWHYSFRTQGWDRVDVPAWVDVLRGASLGDELAFKGRCPGGAVFDPSNGVWTPMSTAGSAYELGASGALWVGVADRLIEFNVESDGLEYEGPFVFEP